MPTHCRIIVATTIILLLVAGCGETAPTAIPPTATTARPSATPIPPTATPAPASTSTPLPQPAEEYQKPGDYMIGIESFGAERTFILHVPPGYQPGVPAPLVFNLHGYDSTAYRQQNQSHMNVKADREGFIVVYPQALQTPPMWVGFMPGPAGYADVRFFQDMIAFLQQEMSIDPARIYATGVSNGAVMANHLGCVMSDTFAAIAPVAGNHIGYDACEIKHPISVVVLHGTADRTAPYNGGGSGVPPVHTWVEAWAQRNGCRPEPSVDDLGQVKEETWTHCDESAAVTLYTIEGGQHEWPGTGFGPGPYPEGLAPDIYATDVIWDFFQAHPKPISLATAAATKVAKESSPARYQSPGDYLDTLVVDGIERWFTIHIPPGYQPGVSMPLVVNLHAYSGTAFAQEEMSQMNAKADEEGFIVVNPQAYNDPPAWTGPLLGKEGQLDLDFFEAMLAYLQRQISIDPARIYATGMSNGGTMTNTLGCVMSDTFAAIAPVAGGHVAFHLCEVDRPVSVLVIHGTNDPTIPYSGRENEVPPVHLWVEAWAKRNGCAPTPHVSHPETDIAQETWENCDDDVVVTLISREGGGHVWPGSTMAIQREGAPSSMNATGVIWDFFETHPRMLAP